MLARSAADRGIDHGLGTGRDRADDVARERLGEISDLPTRAPRRQRRRRQGPDRSTRRARTPHRRGSVPPTYRAARTRRGRRCARPRAPAPGRRPRRRRRCAARSRHGRPASPPAPPCPASETSTMPVTVGSPRRGLTRERGHPLQHRQPLAAHGHRAEVAVRRARQVDLCGHLPLAAGKAHEPVAHALDRLLRARPPAARRRGRVRVSWPSVLYRLRSMTTNGKRRPPQAGDPGDRPRREPRAGRRDRRRAGAVPARHRAHLAPRQPVANPWERAALAEGVCLQGPNPWGDPQPWGGSPRAARRSG